MPYVLHGEYSAFNVNENMVIYWNKIVHRLSELAIGIPTI